MHPTQWKIELTTTTNPSLVADIRRWLKQNGQVVPSRDADVVAKYLLLAVVANNRWGGVPMPLLIRRPVRAGLPWQSDYEGGIPRYTRVPTQPDSLGKQLALGSFGLLVMLALYVAFLG